MRIGAPPLPSRSDLARFGVSDMVELRAGHQSRVFRAQVDAADVAIKLTDRRFSDSAELATRMTVVDSLAARLPNVVAPIRLDGEMVQSIGGWLVTATTFQQGNSPDISQPDTARWLGRTLAELHVGLAGLPAQQLPDVAAIGGTRPGVDRSGWQLLHGDFSDQNIIATPAGLRIFDFDDSGYGPVDYEVANSLYMVLFDDEVHGRTDRYADFRPAFVAGYADATGTRLDDLTIDDWIATRVAALAGWLDDLTTAPIGIRTSSTAWHEVLRTFVRSHQGRGR